MKKLNEIKDLEILHDEPLKNHCTYKIGGPAKALVVPQTLEALKDVLKICSEDKMPHVVIGRGSNALFPDEGLNKIVVKIDANAKYFNYIKTVTLHSRDHVEAGAGTLKEKLVEYALENEVKDFDFLAGIPGTIGGGVRMNAGTSDGKCENIVKAFTTVTLAGEEKHYKDVSKLFSYRKLDIPEDEIIVNIVFHTRKGDKKEIKSKVDAIKTLRKRKHPLSFPNCGSVFKNPPHIPAGLLIEKNNLKGYTVGDAQVSEMHGNFIVNLGNAKASDVKAVIEHVKKVILEKEGIALKEEVIVF